MAWQSYLIVILRNLNIESLLCCCLYYQPGHIPVIGPARLCNGCFNNLIKIGKGLLASPPNIGSPRSILEVLYLKFKITCVYVNIAVSTLHEIKP